MLKETSNIDKIFAQGLEGFQPMPDPLVWEGVKNGLEKNRSRKRAMLLWSMAASVALLMAFLSGYLLSQGDLPTELYVADQGIENSENIILDSTYSTKDKLSTSIIKSKLGHKIVIVGSGESELTKDATLVGVDSFSIGLKKWLPFLGEQAHSSNVVILEHPTESDYLAEAYVSGGEYLDIAIDQKRIAYNRLMMAQVEEEVTKDQKWSIMGQLSSAYASATSSSPRGERAVAGTSTFDANKKGIWSIGGGVKVNFSTGKRISFQTGIYYNKMGQSSSSSSSALKGMNIGLSDASIYAASNAVIRTRAGMIKTNAAANNIKYSLNGLAGQVGMRLESAPQGGTLTQYFESVEVPFLMRYNLLQKRVGIHLLGGVSTNWIVGNKVYLDDGNINRNIGETSNIQTTNFSSQLGFGLEFGVSPHLRFSLEPSFKLYLNSISKSSQFNYRPYSMGVCTGIRYNF